MKNTKVIEIMDKMHGIIEQVPDDVTICYLWLNTNTPFGEMPEITLYESSKTRPNGFYELADKLGVMVTRTERDEENDNLTMVSDGICMLMIVDKVSDDADA